MNESTEEQKDYQGKISIEPNQEGAGGLSKNPQNGSKAYRPACALDLANLPYRLSIFVTLLKDKGQIKAGAFVKLLGENGVFIQVDKDNDGTRELRKMKEETINAGYPIGSNNSRGYFFITNPVDKKDALHEYKSKAVTMLQRMNQINKNTQTFYKLTPDQMTLFSIQEGRAT